MQEDKAIFDQLSELVTSQLEGSLTDQQQRKLAQLLDEDERWVGMYVEMMQDETSLRWWSTGVPAYEEPSDTSDFSEPAKPVEKPRFWRLSRFPMALAAALLLSVVATLSYRSLQGDQAAARGGRSVATLTRLHDVQWEGEAPKTPSELSRISVGQSLQMLSGEAEIIFDDAVQLIVRGPASLEINSAMEITSEYGVISARVGETGKGFAIETPMGRITDLGTEFGVAINRQGATDVAVFQGEIDLALGTRARQSSDAGPMRLGQGHALSLDEDGNMSRLATIDDTRFPSISRGFNPAGQKSTIFTNVSDNIRDDVNAKFYRILPGGLREDAPAFVDRRHEWNGVDESGIPEILLGADYVMPFNTDKYVRDFELELAIGRPAVLYIFLSDINQKPAWLEGFVDTGMKIGLDESGEFTDKGYKLATGPGVEIDTHFSIWKREILAPTTVTLGSVRQARRGFGFCMYGIAAIPLEPVEPSTL